MLRQIFYNMPVVTKNLFLMNVLMFLVLLTGGGDLFMGLQMNMKLGMYYVFSPLFEPYQIVTHMFCHGNFPHLLFNMIALVSIGSLLERVWGPKRFLFFYLFTGLGAVALHQFALGFDLYRAMGTFHPHDITLDGDMIRYPNEYAMHIQIIKDSYFVPTVGASGAVFGLLAGLALLFPNIELMLMFIPIPIKAKYLVPVLMLIELSLGVRNFEMDNVAHFAHLGGALFGFILIQIWKRDRKNFY